MLHYARQISMLCANNNSEIKLVYIATADNRLADFLSRWNLGEKYRKGFLDIISSDEITYKEVDIEQYLFDNVYEI